MSSTNGKAWYFSKTIWGVIIMALSGAASQFGLAEVTPEAQAQIVDWLIQAVGVGAAGVAIWGRVSAHERIES